MSGSRGRTHPRNATARLTRSDQMAFDALVEARGKHPAAELLHIAVTTIERLTHGGHANPATIACVTERLAALK